MDEERKIRKKLLALEDEHRKLDLKIEESVSLNIFEIKHLKKKKLILRDEMARLHSLLYDDIIA